MNQLYPFKFHPIYKAKIWGGNKIKTILHKDFGELTNCGESWELSAVEGDVSVVANGHLAGNSLTELIEQFGADLLGQKVIKQHATSFPLLIKFLDAKEDLSIQVHPNDAQAQAKHGCNGKTEMWYVLDADPGASLISGFKRATNKEEYVAKLESGQLTDLLNREEVSAGDVFYLPAGRIHTIGAGLLIAEIQQSSDVTYRIYDFDRTDAAGNKRELHTAEALEVLDFSCKKPYKTSYLNRNNEVVNLVESAYFITNKLRLDQKMKRNLLNKDSFVIYMCITGGLMLLANQYSIQLVAGETLLVPAALAHIELIPAQECELLEIYMP